MRKKFTQNYGPAGTKIQKWGKKTTEIHAKLYPVLRFKCEAKKPEIHAKLWPSPKIQKGG